MSKRRPQKEQYVEYYSLSPETKRGIFIVFIFIVAIVSVLSFLSLAGRAGVYIDFAFGVAFGWGRYIVPLILIILGYALARPLKYQIAIPNYIGILLFIIGLHGLLHLRLPLTSSFDLSFSGLGGGIVGYLISYPLLQYLGFWAALIILVGIFIASILLMFNTGIESLFHNTNIFRFFQPIFKRGEAGEITEETSETEEEVKEEAETIAEESNDQVKEVKFSAKGLLKESAPEKPAGIKPSHIKIDLPISLLDNKISKPTSGDIKVGMEKIRKTLENFHINVEPGDVQVGPTVTQYTFKPAEGIKLSRITALNNDLALSLAAHPIRIEAPIPGKSLVGVEVPNQKPAIVRVREIIESPKFRKRKNNTEIVLGKDVSGLCWSADLSGMPHLLVAGATGSGKSVCLNSIIISLLYQNNPATLRLILVDPKRVELPIYNGIPHLLTPVITDVTKTIYALRWSISEMDRRFDLLAQSNKRNIEAYNLANKEKLPHIIIVIDELADLMVAAPAEVEGCIIRLTQMARAIGIHLVVATQRPSVDIITGLIKANIPCRIAFSVASLMDSRTILDSSGAEKLVGKGDMLYTCPSLSKPRRLQGAYVSDEEIKRVVKFLKDACNEETQYEDSIVNKPVHGHSSFEFQGDSGDDDMYDEAKKTVIQSGKASASLLQRRLRVGYARAARLIDLLEEAGIVGPADGARPREILVDKHTALTEMANMPTRKENKENIEEETPEEESGENESENDSVGPSFMKDEPDEIDSDESDDSENVEEEPVPTVFTADKNEFQELEREFIPAKSDETDNDEEEESKPKPNPKMAEFNPDDAEDNEDEDQKPKFGRKTKTDDEIY
ncbi:MAG: DNA translocase FtsK 4TM domain-containing protein [Parcubacteria group bacterium]